MIICSNWSHWFTLTRLVWLTEEHSHRWSIIYRNCKWIQQIIHHAKIKSFIQKKHRTSRTVISPVSIIIFLWSISCLSQKKRQNNKKDFIHKGLYLTHLYKIMMQCKWHYSSQGVPFLSVQNIFLPLLHDTDVFLWIFYSGYQMYNTCIFNKTSFVSIPEYNSWIAEYFRWSGIYFPAVHIDIIWNTSCISANDMQNFCGAYYNNLLN